METFVRHTGHMVHMDKAPDRIPDFDTRSGDHLWVILGTWRCNPAKLALGESALLDQENLLGINGPGCLYCAKEYSPMLARIRCKGQS